MLTQDRNHDKESKNDLKDKESKKDSNNAAPTPKSFSSQRPVNERQNRRTNLSEARSHDNTSTDSEAVDSISGYNSWLQRRNQTSKCTHTGSSLK